MNIGEASNATGVSVKMIRHYESIGLIRSPLRTESGYRVYSESEIHTLRFISQARDLGFSIHQMEHLLALWHDRGRASVNVRAIATKHIETLRDKIRALEAMSAALMKLTGRCHGDDQPECAIIEGFATAVPAAPRRRRPRFGIAGTASDHTHSLQAG